MSNVFQALSFVGTSVVVRGRGEGKGTRRPAPVSGVLSSNKGALHWSAVATHGTSQPQSKPQTSRGRDMET